MRLRTFVLALFLALAGAAAGSAFYLYSVDGHRTDGTMILGGLSAPVRVVRDEKAVPYIYAENLDDAIRALGFITGQDRLYQVEQTKYLARGRFSELIGAAGLRSDTELRVIGIPELGTRAAALLSADSRRYVQNYLDGLNAYITQYKDELPLGFRVIGIEPEPWTVEDYMTVHQFLIWNSSINSEAELLAQAIMEKAGPEKGAEITPIVVNPDDAAAMYAATPPVTWAAIGLELGNRWVAPGVPTSSSNHWVIAGSRTSSGMPFLANNPHLDARRLPGIWYSFGLITPDFRAVGLGGSGTMNAGRTSYIAYGVTNSYGDVVDLYIETEDPNNPDHYLEGDVSLPFDVVNETIKVRDFALGGFGKQKIRIRRTRRGPVISDHGMTLAAGKAISLRWSAVEEMGSDLMLNDLLVAKSVDEARVAVGKSTNPNNYVFADMQGNIGLLPGGRIPIRVGFDGSMPMAVTGPGDNWAGFIPWDAMPQETNPARGWTGDANHRYVRADYPEVYSTYAAPAWRYRRMVELLDGNAMTTPEDQWRFMRDVKNTMAEAIAPVMVEALLGHEDTKDLGAIVEAWNFTDDVDQAGPTIFQSVYRHFAHRTFTDELGPDLTARMLARIDYWQERLARMVLDGSSDWFDDQTTTTIETRDDLLHLAALDARAELTERLGGEPADWTWGKVHTITFSSPLFPGDLAAQWLGGGTRPMMGSGETINRGIFRDANPYDATIIDSMRLLVDLGDPDKILAVIPGGVSGRQFNLHLKDQLDAWFSGEPTYLWFSDKAIAEHAQSELRLEP